MNHKFTTTKLPLWSSIKFCIRSIDEQTDTSIKNYTSMMKSDVTLTFFQVHKSFCPVWCLFTTPVLWRCFTFEVSVPKCSSLYYRRGDETWWQTGFFFPSCRWSTLFIKHMYVLKDILLGFLCTIFKEVYTHIFTLMFYEENIVSSNL